MQCMFYRQLIHFYERQRYKINIVSLLKKDQKKKKKKKKKKMKKKCAPTPPAPPEQILSFYNRPLFQKGMCVPKNKQEIKKKHTYISHDGKSTEYSQSP